MPTSAIAKFGFATVLSAASLSPTFTYGHNYLQEKISPKKAVYEIGQLNYSEFYCSKFVYNYIEENFSLKDAAGILAGESRDFTKEEAKAYKEFILEFFG